MPQHSARKHLDGRTVARGEIVAFPFCEMAVSPADRPFEPAERERVALDRLRWLAMRASLKPASGDLEQACFVLAGEPDVSLDRYATLFFRGLQRHSRHRLTMHRPGARALTRDEVWLLRVCRAIEAGDTPLFRSLIAWHVVPIAQRWLRFLADGLLNRIHDPLAA